MVQSNCKECGTEFIVSKGKIGLQKFCSKYCREKNWNRNNPHKLAEYHKKYNKKNSNKKCIICGKKIPYGNKESKRSTLCSDECEKIRSRQSNKKFRLEAQEIFHKWKIEQGCLFCGYNKCPASLDLHHLYGKDFRVTAKAFKGMSEKTKQELKKCIVLCKNCHYELHFKKEV